MLPARCKIVREVTPELVGAMASRKPVRLPIDAAAVLAPRLGVEEVEGFIVVTLDAQHRVITLQVVTRGLLNSSLVHPREVFRLTIVLDAAAIVVAHDSPACT